MFTRKIALAAAAASLAGIAGCPTTGESRTENQGGGSVVTAGIKVLNSNLAALTADEVQILVDRVDERKPNITIDLTDEQAQAIVDFLADNGLTSISAVAAVIQNPDGLVIPPSLEALVEAGDLPEIQRVVP